MKLPPPPTIFRLVIVESPNAGDVQKNLRYARMCMLDALSRGEAPFASHLLYTQVLDDQDSRRREYGIAAGLTWMTKAEAVCVYTDLGITDGMKAGIARAERLGKNVEFRRIEVT